MRALSLRGILMHVRELRVRKFRNIAELQVQFAPGLNLIFGPNAQGKTNLLETIYMLASGRSFRTRTEREMIPWNRDAYDASFIWASVCRTDANDEIVFS